MPFVVNLYEAIFYSAIVAVGGWLLRDLLSAWQKRQRPFSRQLDLRGDVYEALNTILQRTEFRRVLILKTENGGGIPHIGSPIFASVIYEDFDEPFHSVKYDYQRLQVDGWYQAMLNDVAEKKEVGYIVNEMPKGLLREIYEAEKVAVSYVFYLHETTTAFYYMSISTDAASMAKLNAQDLLTARIEVARIRDVFKKM